MKLKLENADLIKKLIRLEEGRAEIIFRVYCPFCRTKYALLLVGRTGRYECQVCCTSGRLADLVVYFEDMFEKRHGRTMRLMSEKSAVEVEVER